MLPSVLVHDSALQNMMFFAEQDKENDIRNAQATLATQAAIQRRRRPKRRSTGVVSFDGVDVSTSDDFSK